MSEKQKVRARRVRWLKRLSVLASCGMIGWSAYALLSFKPPPMDAKVKQLSNASSVGNDAAPAAVVGPDVQTQKASPALTTGGPQKSE